MIFKKELMMKTHLEQLNTLLNIESPTGNTAAAIEYVEHEFKKLGLQTHKTPKGALVASIKGTLDDALTLSAHVDTLGAMVKEIKPNGMLKLTQLGGYAWPTIEGEYVTINNGRKQLATGTVLTIVASSHVHGAKTGSLERNADTLEVRLDAKTRSKKETEALGIQVGDFVNFDPRTTFTDTGFIKSRHLDDKACVVALLAVAKELSQTTPKNTINFFISNYEEVGHGASAGIPANTKEFIALDMAAPGPGQTSDEYSVTICTKDSSGPYDLNMRHKLEDLAIVHEIPYQLDIYPFYGSDASAALRSGGNFPCALIGPGVDASHSYERTHEEAIQATIDLTLAYINQ